jgi:hypothetical protein
MRQLTRKEQQEYLARYEIEVNAAIDLWLDYWKDISPDTRKFLHAELRRALESKLRDKVRALSKVKGAA